MSLDEKVKLIDSTWNKKDPRLLKALSWEIKERGIEFTGKVFKIKNVNMKHPKHGKEFTFLQLSPRNWVNVFALTKDNRLVVIEQFRYGSEDITLETPGGVVEDEEPIEAGARRELLEETGFQANKMLYLNKINPNPAFNTNCVYYFLALGCEYKQSQRLDPGELIATATIRVDDFESLIEQGKITHSLVVAGFLFFKKKAQSMRILE